MRDFFTVSFLLQLLTACGGTLAFAVLFKVRAKHLPFAGLCGALTYILYYTVAFFGGSLFSAAFISTAAAAVFSECCARLRRAPAPVFLVPGTIPIVPGSDLYYTMRYLLSGNFADFTQYLIRAVLVGLGIGGGIVTVSLIFGLIFNPRHQAKHV
ncbi:MAG: threonine/serine exporter family protein [Clostridia bacterium]|nr:threonine/serine exporter family protein [Clostridia bacterium]